MPITIYGNAAGHGTTQGAARGALCIRTYDTPDYPRADWLAVLIIQTTPAPAQPPAPKPIKKEAP